MLTINPICGLATHVCFLKFELLKGGNPMWIPVSQLFIYHLVFVIYYGCSDFQNFVQSTLSQRHWIAVVVRPQVKYKNEGCVIDK